MRSMTQMILLAAVPVAAVAQTAPTSPSVPEEALAEESSSELPQHGPAEAEEASVASPAGTTQPPLIQAPPPPQTQPDCDSVSRQAGDQEVPAERTRKAGQIAEETGTAVGSTVGTGLGAAVAGPIGAAAGSVLVGHVGKAVTSVFKGKGKKKKRLKADRAAQSIAPPGCQVVANDAR